MENDEGAVDLLLDQALQQVFADIDAEGIDPGGQQGLQDHRAGLQRHLALGALATEQHGDTAERLGILGAVQQAIEAKVHAPFLPCRRTAGS